MEQTLWGHLPVLVRANSKESIEYILQSLWRTRKSGLHSTERCIIQDMLQLQNESDLDPLLVCLRMLIRRCVYENTSKEDIPKLFPSEVLPELQKLLTLLLHKFQREWQEDVMKDQNIVPRLKAMTWNMANLDKELADPAAVINLKLQNDAQFHSGEQDVKFQLATDSLEMMLKAMHCIRDQFSTTQENIEDRPKHGESKLGPLVGSCGIIRAKASTDQIIYVDWYSLFRKKKC
ncbi:Protein FAR1-RELATED SEQUENCE 3 [Mucuna pruriens]|uniref:Protein FAR1-RELATED SEQUENCE 3 n=1 Tax=Mucuna pruriens TaxID=157652 RepID=A0A371GBG6_MUCPR|nr:Protein FAR1-RELATED SEQUENCE 3 [Mucuna pruriens]